MQRLTPISRRVKIRTILHDPKQRKRLMVGRLIAIQARAGIETTQDQAETAYDAVRRERPAGIFTLS